ncbi:hypothetical protein SAMN04488089_109137 [Myroides profundi]|uniref:Virulence protein n=1 Tax=Myroides profundi TaxID=480520 RepID=A0AAJ4W540_MYRPR|nr:Virulence protein [Myroides profundi]SER11517.1 hypothetical protein SAMN04488089_109137 [Myroides profundi]
MFFVVYKVLINLKKNVMAEHGSILIYQTKDVFTKIETRLENETLWLTQV